MPKKPTFLPRNNDGTLQAEPVAYTPLMFIVGTEVHRLALHKAINSLPDEYKEWDVSEPLTGMRVCRVRASYKGAGPISSRGMRVSDAKQCALACVEEVISREGSDRFNAVVAAAKKKYLT